MVREGTGFERKRGRQDGRGYHPPDTELTSSLLPNGSSWGSLVSGGNGQALVPRVV